MSQFKRSLTRFGISVVRGVLPKLTIGSKTLLFREADVVEVLTRDKDFTLEQLNRESIERRIGPFMLGMDDGPEYQRETGIMRSVIRRGDADLVRTLIRKDAAEIAGQLKENGKFDFVGDFARIVPQRLIDHYWGVPAPMMEHNGVKKPDIATMLRWNRTLFWDIFLDLKQEPQIVANAAKSADEMNAYLKELIAAQKEAFDRGARLGDNLMARLIGLIGTDQPHFDQDGIRRNLAGTFLGALEPTARAVTNILNQFFLRPEVHKQALEAAAKDDAKTMLGLAMEALRFHPNLPLIMRYAEKDQVIGGNGRAKRKIKAGKQVWAMTLSAMFDPRAFPKPGNFDPSRPLKKYLHFGHGIHECLGNYINYVSIPEMLIAILKLEGLKPAPGKSGKIENEGPFPSRWELVVKA